MNKTYTQKYRIRFSEACMFGKLKTVSLLNYLQDIASEHVTLEGISNHDLMKDNLAWVINRYTVSVITRPFIGETIEINTRRYPDKNLYDLRNYRVLHPNGETLAVAKTSSVLIKLDSRRPVRINRNLHKKHLEHLAPIENDFKEIPAITRVDHENSFKTRMQDLDINRHTNNTVYAAWTSESVPVDILQKFRPCHYDIKFMGEAVYGDHVLCRTQRLESTPDNPEFLHQIIRTKDGQELTRLKTRWQRYNGLV